MKMTEIVFSPTGGTQKVADIFSQALATELGAEVEQIDLSDPFIDETDLSVDSDFVAVIAMPCFGGRVPAVAMRRLNLIAGNKAKCIVINVYGNRAFDDALLEMEDGARNSGFDVIAAIAAIAEHSIMHQFAAGRPDDTDVDNLQKFAKEIALLIKSGEALDEPSVPGDSPYLKASAVPLVPHITGKCVSCGKCSKSCPVTAINSVDFKADKNICIACMRCIEVCPENARSINSVMVKAASMAIKKQAKVRKEAQIIL